jgi:hypothetical protein
MKFTTSQILITASLVAALILGSPLFRFLWRHVYASPGSHIRVLATRTSFAGPLLVSLSPLALYAAAFALAGSAAWSRLGKVGLFVQIAYCFLLVGSWIYFHRLFLLNRNA